MSKHEKQIRRERRKDDRSRRQRARASFRHPTSHIPHKGAMALAAAAAIASGTVAYAAPVRFDNPAHGAADHFHWEGSPPVLDITFPAVSQPGSFGDPGTFYLFTGTPGIYASDAGLWTDFGTGMVGLYAAGDLIDSSPGGGGGAGAGWTGSANVSNLPLGQSVYLAVRFFDPGDGYHYGWIGANKGTSIETFAWGYETDAGVPIPAGAPEPGSLALLALGAAGVAGRRSRRQRHDN